MLRAPTPQPTPSVASIHQQTRRSLSNRKRDKPHVLFLYLSLLRVILYRQEKKTSSGIEIERKYEVEHLLNKNKTSNVNGR